MESEESLGIRQPTPPSTKEAETFSSKRKKTKITVSTKSPEAEKSTVEFMNTMQSEEREMVRGALKRLVKLNKGVKSFVMGLGLSGVVLAAENVLVSPKAEAVDLFLRNYNGWHVIFRESIDRALEAQRTAIHHEYQANSTAVNNQYYRIQTELNNLYIQRSTEINNVYLRRVQEVRQNIPDPQMQEIEIRKLDAWRGTEHHNLQIWYTEEQRKASNWHQEELRRIYHEWQRKLWLLEQTHRIIRGY